MISSPLSIQQQQESGLIYNPQIRQIISQTSYNPALDPRTGSFEDLMDRKKKEKKNTIFFRLISVVVGRFDIL